LATKQATKLYKKVNKGDARALEMATNMTFPEASLIDQTLMEREWMEHYRFRDSESNQAYRDACCIVHHPSHVAHVGHVTNGWHQ